LTWTLTLPDGLRFHDKEPVLAHDVVASIRRFAARISFADAGAAGGDLPFKPIGEVIGSGPFRFLPDEHISGARAAYERFALYQPRGTGAVGFIFPTESRTFRSGRVAGPGSFFGHGGTA
jgi:peptide/nickel transport system substrate-binding protein